MLLAWDIETCPTPLDELTDQQRERYEKQLQRQLKKRPDMDEADASQLVRSVHPHLGWICCISLVRHQETPKPKSYKAADMSEEPLLLDEFWGDLSLIRARPTWITFNGKRFDAPFLLQRSYRHQIAPTRGDLLDTYPYKNAPHADLATTFRDMSLADVCDLLGVASPKSDLCGADVADAVSAGRIDDVARYCEGDVIATLNCFRRSLALVA